jgi:hypothetical protein
LHFVFFAIQELGLRCGNISPQTSDKVIPVKTGTQYSFADAPIQIIPEHFVLKSFSNLDKMK